MSEHKEEKESFREKILSDMEKQRLKQYADEGAEPVKEAASSEHIVPEFEAFKNSETVEPTNVEVPDEDLSAEQVLDHLDHLFDPDTALDPSDPLNPDYSGTPAPEHSETEAAPAPASQSQASSQSQAQAESLSSQAPEASESLDSEAPVAYERYYDPERGKFVRRRLTQSTSESLVASDTTSESDSDSSPYEEVAITYSAAGTTVPVTYNTSQNEDAEAAQTESETASHAADNAAEEPSPIERLKESLAASTAENVEKSADQADESADSAALAATGSDQPADSEEKTPSRSQDKKGKKKASLARRIAKRIILFFVLLLVIAGLGGGYYVYDALQPVDSSSTDYVQVQIPEGAGNRLIGQTLEKAGVIKSASIFNYYTKFRNYSSFTSGYYNLQKSMSMDQIISTLQAGGTETPTAPIAGKVTIPEGYTMTQIAEAITSNSNTKNTSDKTPFTSEAFLQLVQDDSFIARMKEKYPTLLANLPDKSSVTYVLEGYLFPATYDYYDNSSLEDLVDQMLAAMDSNLSSYYSSISASGRTVHEVLTLASIVEKEGNTDDDRRKIASVFENRMNQGMALQSNVPLLYATGKLGTSTTLAEDAGIDTSMDSPYNDYTNTGLPPGPVDSPSLAAITAVINPDSTDYLYFVADVTTGTVYYSTTYEEHQQNVEKYVNSQLSSSASSSN